MAAGPPPDLRIVSRHVYRGPNYWSYEPAIRLLVDLGELEEHPTDRLPGFTERLVALLPGLEEHTCSVGRRGGFIQRMVDGTWAGHVAEHVALQLQSETGAEVSRGKTRSADRPGRYHVIYGWADERVGLAAGDLAVRIVNHLVRAEDGFDPPAEIEVLIRLAQRIAYGPSTQALLEEAASRDIPAMRLDRGSFVQLGQGVYQRRIRATMTSLTSSLAVDVASDKELTGQLLAAAGLPVPGTQAVRHVDDAVAIAARLGYPVVLKPLDGNHGRGVGLDLRDEAAVRAAYEAADRESRRGDVVVERYLTGNDYRVLVIGGRMVALAERVPAHVVGDGLHTVAELVEETNADPRRGVGHEKVLTRITVDRAAEALLAEQGWALDAVPPAGEMVKLTLTGNMSTGGIAIDRTDEAHPDNVEIAEEAAQVVGLDVAGIDFIAPDITEPVRETGGGIVEVNAAPGFRMHTHPTVGEPQYVAKPVLDLLFPPGTPSRIPIVAITGTNGKTTTARMVAHIMKAMGRKVGMTSTDGVVIDERLVLRADASGPKSARMVLQNPRVDFAVFEVARGGILREGLGYERNDVGVVLNVAADHLGLAGIASVDDLADVKRVVVEAVPRDGVAVLNADDRRVARMRRACRGEVLLFSLDPANQLVIDHTRRGGRAVVLEPTSKGDVVVLREGRRAMPLSFTQLLPATFEGRALMNVANAMAAAGATWASGAHLHDIRHGLRTFQTSFHQAPGRLNLVNVNGVRVIVDYAHNPAGMTMLGDFIERLEEEPGDVAVRARRRYGVVATAGDRRDEDLRDLGEVAARHFDALIVREDLKGRGREPGATAAQIALGARAAMAQGARCRELDIVIPELEATAAAMDRASPGDLVVICVEQTSKVWTLLQDRIHPGTDLGHANLFTPASAATNRSRR